MRPSIGLAWAIGLAIVAWRCPMAAGAEYRNEKHGYSLTFPKGWAQVPSSVIENLRKLILTQNARSDIIYDACYQKGSLPPWPSYPYVLLQYLPYSQYGGSGEPDESQFPKMVEAISGL